MVDRLNAAAKLELRVLQQEIATAGFFRIRARAVVIHIRIIVMNRVKIHEGMILRQVGGA